MNKEVVVCIYNGMLCSHKKRRNLVVYCNLDRIRVQLVKKNKSKGGQILNDVISL